MSSPPVKSRILKWGSGKLSEGEASSGNVDTKNVKNQQESKTRVSSGWTKRSPPTKSSQNETNKSKIVETKTVEHNNVEHGAIDDVTIVKKQETKSAKIENAPRDSDESKVDLEHSTQSTEEKVDEWMKSHENSPPNLDSSISSLISNYSSRYHNYGGPAGLTIMPIDEYAKHEAQEFRNDRIGEKKQMGRLNNRLGNYIEHVKNLESENIALLAELKTYQEKYKSMQLHLKMKYQTEIDECHTMGSEQMDQLEKLKARQKALKEEWEEWRKKYNDLLEGKDYTTDVRRLELMIKEKDGEISAMHVMINGLERDLEELLRMLDRLQRDKQELMATNSERSLTWDLKQKIGDLQRMKDENEKRHNEDVARLKKSLDEQRNKRNKALTQEEKINILREIYRNNPGLLPFGADSFNAMITEITRTHTSDASTLNMEVEMAKRKLDELKQRNEWLRKRIAELEKLLRNRRETSRSDIDARNLRIRDVNQKYTTETIEYREAKDVIRLKEDELARLKRQLEELADEERKREELMIIEKRRIESMLEAEERQRQAREEEERLRRLREEEERQRRAREEEERRRRALEEEERLRRARELELKRQREHEEQLRQERIRLENELIEKRRQAMTQQIRVKEETAHTFQTAARTEQVALQKVAPPAPTTNAYEIKNVIVRTETVTGPTPKPVPRKPKRKETALTVTWDEIKPKSEIEVYRTNTGPVSIAEVDRNGMFLLLENASFKLRKDQFMGKWKLQRWMTPSRKVVFTFPDTFTLKHGQNCKIWVRGAGGIHNPPDQLIWQECSSWGVGINLPTVLLDEHGEEKATHIERMK